MAGTTGKPNNDLYDLNDLLTGVTASEDSLEDIMAEVYGKKPASEKAPPPPEEPPVTEPVEPLPPEEFVPDLSGLFDPEEDGEDPPITEEEPEPPPFHAPPVVRDSDEAQPDVLSDPEEGKHRSKLVLFPGTEQPPAPPSSPSAWEEPERLMPEELFTEEEEQSRPDGYTPKKKVRSRMAPEPETREDYRAAASEEEALPKNASPLAHWKAKADAFADSMFSQAATTDEDVEMAEKYIPGTDEEEDAPAPEEQEKAEKQRRRLRRYAPRPEADISTHEMSRIYFTGLNFMSQRLTILSLLTIINAYLALAADAFLPLPLPQVLMQNHQLLAMCQLWIAGWAVVFSLDVLWIGLTTLKKRMFTLHTLGTVAVLITLLDAFLYCVTGREGPLPYSAPATLSMLCLTWGAFDRKLANQRSCRQASVAQDPKRLTKDPELWNARDTFTKERGDTRQFGAQIQAPSEAELIQSRFAPIILIASILCAILVCVAHKDPHRFIWVLSAILMAASPLSALLSFSQPWLKLTRRLERSGAAVAGWPGVQAAAGTAGVLISDTDLFPAGSIQFNGIKVYGEISLEKLVGCAASLIRTSGSSLAIPFDSLVRTQGGFYRRVDNFQCYEAGGLSGDLRGEHIMVGSASFMAVMDIPLPQDLKVKNAVFCAIDGSLRGIFALNYAKTNSVRPAVLSLLQARLVPVLVPRDFNVNPSMVRQKLKIPVEKMEYPPVERRMELTEPEQEHSPILTALLSRDSVESYAETIVGCRKLRSAVQLNVLASVLASLVGLAMGYYLTAMGAFASLSPVNLLAFLALWLIPTLLISGNVNRY